jgi:Domain of unknown function (DUF4340)
VDKRIWINIGLLAFIVLLATILLLPAEKTEQELPRLSTIDSNNIVQIEVFRKGLDNFSFNKQVKAWYMNSPLQFRANKARINAMLRMLKVESHGQLNPAEHELKQFDLADPIITMKLNDHVFQFGNTDAIDQRRYVLFNNSIHMVNDFLYQQLMTNAAFFADTKLLPDNLEINSIQYPDNQIDLVDGHWQMQTLMDISPDQLKRIVFNWQNATALSVSKYDAPESITAIKLSTSNGESVEFIIVATEPHLILSRKDLGIQYHMGSDEADKLLLIENPDTNVPSEVTEPE